MTFLPSHPNPLLRTWRLGEDVPRPSVQYRTMRRFLQMIMCPLWKMRIFGRHYEPADGGAVYVCNHQSFLDPALMALALRRPVDYMARDTLFDVPVFGRAIRSLNAFPIRRASADISSLKEAMRRLKAGALAVFASYWNIPLDQYFDDPSLKAKVVSCGRIPLAGRRSQFIAPGDWSSKPNNLLPRLKRRITPAYGFVPEVPSAWTVLATAARSGGKPFPYILARPYGKGMIVLCGDSIPIPAAKMLENFVSYHSGER